MIAVLLVIHMILAVAIIGLVLIQRSEGGGLGLGSGGGLGSFATPQATAGALNRVTWICAGLFFVTSLALGVLYNHAASQRSILDRLDQPAAVSAPAADAPAVPDTAPPATPAKDADKPKAAEKPKPEKSEPSVPVSP